MESQTLLIRARRRIMCHQAKSFQFMVVLICTLFHLAACGPCSVNGIHSPVEYDTVKPYSDNHNAGFQDVYIGGVSSGFDSKGRLGLQSVENICGSSNLFCFPSTLLEFLSEEYGTESTVVEASGVQSDATSPLGSVQERRNLSRSSDHGMFLSFTGRALSCSLNSQERIHDISSIQTSSCNENHVSSCGRPLYNEKIPSSKWNGNSAMIKSGFLDGSLSDYLRISPPLLDWGHKYLYSPSFAFLTVKNTHSEIILNIYEPFSPNTQFYPCNFSEVLLRPGEAASICFVFLPLWLGMSSAHLILQTSSGGFLIQAKGFAVESPYGIRPLMGVDISSNGRWRKNLSLFNPFDETLYVEEVTAWVSVSLGNTSHSTKAICKIESYQGSADRSVMNVKEWLDVKSDQVGSPLMAMRPHRNWDIGPGSTETVLEIDYSYNPAGKVFGAFCLQLLRSSEDKSDMIMVPLGVEVGEFSNHPADSVSLSLHTLVPCDAGETAVVALSLGNGAHLLNVVKISLIGEGTKLFQVKYVEGLILFPGTVTQVAVVSYSSHPPSETPNTKLDCKIVILINDSSRSEIEVLCKDIVNVCWKLDSYPNLEQHVKASANARTGSLGSSGQSPFQIKAMDAAEPDEFVLGNWKSLGTAIGMSVLHDHEVLFPTVQVGTYQSKWITVKNPSQQPVVMQLILNSGVIVDGCRSPDGTLQPSSSSGLVLGKYTTPIRYGFSIGESAQTEAYVRPYETASFGPILFHPSNRCAWRSSALIRNNLSGVEWLSLRGFGGSFSLVLFEGSKPVQSLEFKLNLPTSLNISPSDVFHKTEEASYTCSQPLSKELYAKNTGDLPLELRRIEVSGSECGLDGFLVHTCKGFALQPGESIKLLISYKTDFSAVNVHRELELAFGTGILVIPMKASLPLHLLNFCKKSMFWLRVKKFCFVFLSSFGVFFVLFYILPQLLALGSQDYTLKSGESSIATVRRVGKSSRVHRNQKNSGRFSVSSKMKGFFRSIKEDNTLLLNSVTSYPEGEGVALEQGHVKPTVGSQRQTNYLFHAQKELAFESFALPESSTVEHSDVRDVSKDGKLTVRVGKEKGRRRRKKKGSGTGLAGIFEVSSSQSGNSTPSSPLSPVMSSTPKRSWPLTSGLDQTLEARNQFAEVAQQKFQKISGTEASTKGDIIEPEVSMKFSNESRFVLVQEKPTAPRKLAGKPVLLPSATFPCTNRPGPTLMASMSSIPPHARAPGSKVYNQKAVQTEEKTGHEDHFKYDIWGDHLSGLHLMGKPKEGSSMTSGVSESPSDSFFASGPQTLVSKSQPRSVSSYQVG